MATPAPRPPRRDTMAGGFPIAIGTIAGALIGLVNDQATLGLLLGLAIGVAIAILLWRRTG